MRPELLGMSNEELIQWACDHGAINENVLRKEMLGIEAFCGIYPVSVSEILENAVDRTNGGCSTQRAVYLAKEAAKCE